MKMFFRQILLIAWTDFKQLALHPLFLSALGLCCLIISYLFPRALFDFASSYVMPTFQQDPNRTGNIHFDVFQNHIALVNMLLLFLTPPLSIKFLVEEKKNNTFDLLMTAPLSSLQIVIGKYLGLLLTLLCFLSVTILYPLSTVFVTEIPLGPFVTSWIGFFLLTAVYAAIGLFASSLTVSVILSVIMGWIFNFSIWFISQGRDFSTHPVFQSIMEYLSLHEHLMNFLKGNLVLSSFVFFFSCIIFFLFLVYKVIEFSRWRS